jgi:hypothetical protein
VSCSSIHSLQREANRPDHVDVGIKDPTLEKINTKELSTKVKTEETVRIGTQGGELYNNLDDLQVSAGKMEKKIRIGINLGPGLNRVINYVSVLKVLERHNLSPTVVTGTGMGAIVAAMYAEGMTPEVIEWNFYKYFKETKINKPYEKDWIKHVDRVLLSKFKNSKIEETKKSFL